MALVTGANSGIGFHTARVLAERGAHVIGFCRNEVKAREALGRIHGSTELVLCDLADLASVREAARQVRASHDRLDLLVNNAGVLLLTEQRTAEGFELQIAVNHLAHFALTGLLCDLVLAAPSSRIVTVASNAHKAGRLRTDDLHWAERRFRAWTAYGTSKLANLMFAFELDRRLRLSDVDTISLAAHPGGTYTDLGRPRRRSVFGLFDRLFRPVTRLVLQDARAGALPTLRAATDPEASGGEYFGPRGLFELRGAPVRVEANARAHDEDTARALWDVSVKETGVSFDLPGG